MARLIDHLMANVGMAVVYFLAGFLTLHLLLIPNGTSPLWAPAGIALGAVLIWGYRILPGVFIGELAVGHFSPEAYGHISLLCVLTSLQAMLQAGLGRFLLLRFKAWPAMLISGIAIFKFFVISAVLVPLVIVCLFAVAQLSLGLSGSVSGFESSLVRWVGSASGIVSFTPIVLILFAEPSRFWHGRIFTVVLPILALFIALLFILDNSLDIEHEKRKTEFKDKVLLAHTLIERQFDMHQSLLNNLQAYFENSEYVTEQEFSNFTIDFADSREQRTSYHFAWAKRVSVEQRAEYERQLEHEIKTFSPATNGFVVNESQQADYFVTHYEAEDAMSAMLGTNICGDVVAGIDCERMIKTGQPQLVFYPNMLSGNLNEHVLLHALPVYKQDHQLDGMVYQLLAQCDVAYSALTSRTQERLDLTIVDKTSGKTLCSTPSLQERALHDLSRYAMTQDLNVIDQQWQLNYSPSPAFMAQQQSWLSYSMMLASFLVLSLITILLMALTGRTHLIKKEVDEKTREITLNSQLLEESEAKYRCLIENIDDAYILYRYGTSGVFSYVSPSVTRILGYEQEEFLQHYATFWTKSDLNEQAYHFAKQTLSGQATEYEVEIVAKNGDIHTFNVHERPIFDEPGQTVAAVEGIARDITESKAVRLNLEKLSLAMRHNPNAVVITDREGNIEYVNPKFTTITGYSANEAIGKWPDIISSENTDPELYKDVWETLLSGFEWRGELQNRKKNGDLYWAQEVIAPMLDESGHVTHFVVTQEDITQARQLSEQTSYQASYDLLTGLMNRHEFETRLKRAITSSKRDLTEHALCYLDLDQFKVVNDTCGHVAGDELLRQIGAMMSSNVRSRDTLARLGGDEFVLLMEHCGIEQAHQACELLLDLFRNFRFHWEDHVFTIGVSIGLAIIDQHIKDSSEAMKNADSACYDAKDNGRNQVKVYTEDHARLQRRQGDIQWSSEISDALDNNRLLLYAQPIVSLKDVDLCAGYEILVRMQMKDGRIVPPGAFLPAAERYNSASRIDRWVVNHTLHWMNKHLYALSEIGLVSINLSGQSLDDEAMTEYIIHELDRGDIPAERIKFEITETAAIANLHDATQFISRLREFGCRFALDDFGSGLSSFAYLKNLDVDTLKIDGMFIKDMLDDSLDYEMVKSINEIGHVMGLETVAEFVESEAILAKLKEIGIDYAQGYSLGEPVPIDEIIKAT